MENQSLNREAAIKIARRADGNYNEALRLANHAEDNNQELFNRWMQLLYSNNAGELVKWVDEISRIGRESQKSFFRYALEFLHECVVLQQTGEEQSRLQEEEKRLAAWLCQRMEADEWQAMTQYFNKAHYHIERNAHPKILFMNLSLQLQKIISRKKLSLTE